MLAACTWNRVCAANASTWNRGTAYLNPRKRVLGTESTWLIRASQSHQFALSMPDILYILYITLTGAGEACGKPKSGGAV